MDSATSGFVKEQIKTNGITLSVHHGGHGAPLILLHGYPQNHMCWSKVAPDLARDFHVIIPDLRGYGESEVVAADEEHRMYSKREMALDVAGVMDHFGIEKAHIAGHDRGARVAYRFALDHPDRLERLAILEIVPTVDFWAAWDAELAMKAYHWTFLAQPAPLPERMIATDGPAYMDWTLASWTYAKDLSAFSDAALAAYRAQAADPARIAAMCNDYRAGAFFDRGLDAEDRAAGRMITAPLCFLWAEAGFPARTGDPLGIWRAWAENVTGQAVANTGHFMPEEQPEAVLAALRAHFL
ncbi:MAG: alpha/beta fold hydrolase [Paracoccaceae bacterium]|jgi:haloacetate dehalogenase|uniref:alpha/beta fold hydrolase n=1 Tax=unclassified Roseobacter TaxID=196798 RepID=UPI001DD7A281|nr:alpha/beta fold hydrolase [Rhodobacterales bacterium HKCCD6035]